MIIPIITIPKSGTYFMNSIIQEVSLLMDISFYSEFESPPIDEDLAAITNNGYSCYLTHCKYSSENYNTVIKYNPIFVYRNPLDIAVSFVEGALKSLFRDVVADRMKKMKKKEDMYLNFLRGMKNVQHRWAGGFPKMLEERIGWVAQPGVFSIKYEQLYNVKRCNGLASVLKVRPAVLHSAVYNAKRKANSQTFRKGGIGNWKTEMPDSVKEEYIETLKPVLGELGYDPKF